MIEDGAEAGAGEEGRLQESGVHVEEQEELWVVAEPASGGDEEEEEEEEEEVQIRVQAPLPFRPQAAQRWMWM